MSYASKSKCWNIMLHRATVFLRFVGTARGMRLVREFRLSFLAWRYAAFTLFKRCFLSSPSFSFTTAKASSNIKFRRAHGPASLAKLRNPAFVPPVENSSAAPNTTSGCRPIPARRNHRKNITNCRWKALGLCPARQRTGKEEADTAQPHRANSPLRCRKLGD